MIKTNSRWQVSTDRRKYQKIRDFNISCAAWYERTNRAIDDQDINIMIESVIGFVERLDRVSHWEPNDYRALAVLENYGIVK